MWKGAIQTLKGSFWPFCGLSPRSFVPDLEGRHFTVVTDHQALLGNFKLKHPTLRVVRFLLKLSAFDYTFKYQPGAKMSVPDALSRIEAVSEDPDEFAVFAVCMEAVNGTRQHVPDQQTQTQIVWDYHVSLGHPGWKKVYNVLQRRFYWPRQRQFVWKVLGTCPQCAAFNPPTQAVGTPVVPVKSERPNQVCCIDYVGPLPRSQYGARYILLGVDHYTKFAFCHVVRKATARRAVVFLREVFQQLDTYEEVIHDAGSQFTAKLFGRFLSSAGVVNHCTGTAHFEASGSVERLVRTLNTMLAKQIESAEDWAAHVQEVLNQYNSTPHAATGMAPKEAHFGSAVELPPDLSYGVSHLPPASIDQGAVQR